MTQVASLTPFRSTLIDSHDLMEGMRHNNADILAFTKEMKELTGEFETKVYNKGLRSHVDRFGSQVGFFGGVKLSAYAQRGRVYVQLGDDDCYVRLVADESGAPKMVFGYLCATPDNAVSMVLAVINAWLSDSNPCGKLQKS